MGIVEMQFTAFDVEFHSTCSYDHVTIKNGDGTTLMEKTCGWSLPAAVTSTSNIVEIYFHTDHSRSRSGWRLTWRAVTPGSVCPGPTPPTPGQPCSQLPGALDCSYDRGHDCCGRCASQMNFTCVPDSSTTGSKVWQLMSPCPSDCCGSEGVVTSPNHHDNYPDYLRRT